MVITLLLGGLWSNQVQAGEAGTTPRAILPQPPVLNEKDLSPYKQKGRSTLAGQAFLGLPSGKAVTQAGALVHLIPITPYTRYWFDRTVRAPVWSTTGTSTVPESTPATSTLADCAHEALSRLRMEKRLAPYLRATRANPTGHFWFTKIPAGRYYIISLIEGDRERAKEEQFVGLAWLILDLEAGEKVSNLVVTDCKTSLC
ncbi:MAG: hypothetical protein CAF45_014695 [Nitrospira sp. CG24E]|nr:MAG: hypothetical protein CAF45_014695 [Nitrospira sp. CG24E]